MNKIGKYVLVFILSLVAFLNLNIYAEEETESVKYTMTIDPNGGVQGEEFKSTIVLLEDENYAVSGYNEKFLKAPEGKKFAGIELINADGEFEGKADSILLWGYDFNDKWTLKFHWGDIISDINLNLEYPNAGDSTSTTVDEEGYYDTYNQTNKPKITVESNYGAEVVDTLWVDSDSYNEEYEYYEKPFIGTFESGKTYYATVDLSINGFDYAYNDANLLNVKVNGKDVKPYKVLSYSTSVSLTLEVKLDEETYEVIKGDNQKVVNVDSAEFEIDADYNLFKDGGKVFIDEETSPLDPSNYTSKSGSTIITLNKEYVSTLSEGEHTLKVLFNNNKVANATFTVTKNSSDEKVSNTNTVTETKNNSENEIKPPHTGINNMFNKYMVIIYEIILTIYTLGIIKNNYFKKEIN